jgi:hypothetical protein
MAATDRATGRDELLLIRSYFVCVANSAAEPRVDDHPLGLGGKIKH